MRAVLKIVGHCCSLMLVSPCALTSALESWLSPSSTVVFRFWGELMSFMPGLPGAYLRRAYYCWTLEACSVRCHIGFGTIFAHRQAIVEDSVYLGAYALLGTVTLREGCLIGSRSSIISGGNQHVRDADGSWAPTQLNDLQNVEIGENAWLGEACVIAAPVGPGAMVSAGAVVANRVPANVMVAGNPARFVKRFAEPNDDQQEETSEPAQDADSPKIQSLVEERPLRG